MPVLHATVPVLLLLAVAGETPESEAAPEAALTRAFLSLQDHLRRGEADKAAAFLGEDFTGRLGSRRAFLEKLGKKPEPFLTCAVVTVAVQGNRGTITTTSALPELRTLTWEQRDGVWRLEELGTERRPYPAGNEEVYAGFGAAFADLCVLREKIRFLNDMLARRRVYGVRDTAALDEHRAALGATFAALTECMLKEQAAYRALIGTREGDAMALKAAIEKELADFRARFEPHRTWAKDEKLLVPELPAATQFVRTAREGLWFGVMVRHFDYEAFPAWRSLGFDFVCIDIGWGGATVPWKAGVPDFERIDRYLQRNEKHGYRTDLGQAGLGAVDFCLWNPAEQKRWETYFRALGEHFGGYPATLCYEIFNEPDNRAFNEERGDDGRFAVEAFRRSLRERYETIAALNDAWSTSFEDFEKIPGPVKRKGFGPAARDFRRFLQKSMAEFLGACMRVLKKADSGHPVLTQVAEGGGSQDGFLIGAQGADFFSLHMAFGGPPGGANNMAQAAGLARFLGKPLWHDEFIFNGPEAERSRDREEIGAAINRNIWQAVGWGYRGIEFFELDNEWQGWRNAILDPESGYGIVRPESARIPVAIALARELESVLLASEPAPPEVGLVDSPSTRLDAVAGKRHQDCVAACERFLGEASRSYTTLPEAGLAKRTELWEKLRVVILPECLYLDGTAAEALERYTALGGVLIRLGKGGILNESGKPSKLSRLLLARKRLVGRGYVLTIKDLESGAEELRVLLERAVGAPRVSVTPAGGVQAFLRQRGATKILILVNLSPREPVEARVSVREKFTRATDLIAQASIRVETVEGVGSFDIVLEPGGVALLELGGEGNR
jgi:hypothetical protein